MFNIIFIINSIKNIKDILISLALSFLIIESFSYLYAQDTRENDLSIKQYYDLYLKCETQKETNFNSEACNRLSTLVKSLENNNDTLSNKEQSNLEEIYQDIDQKLKEKNIDKKDRLYLLINKVKTLNIILLVNKDSKDEKKIQNYKQQILLAFDNIIDESDSYEKEQALYLKALYYERYNDMKKSIFYHNLLSSSPFKTKYGLLSSVHLGDHFYSKKEYKKATGFYLKAKSYLSSKEYQNILDDLNNKDKFYYASYFEIDKDIVYDMDLKISYRLSWSYFLNNDLSKSIKESSNLLSMYGKDLLNMYQYKKVKEDMISIISDSLYELSYKEQDLYFKDKDSSSKEEVSLSLAKKYKQELLYEDCIRVADNYYYPDTKEYLYLLSTKVSCYKSLKREDDKYLQSLEQLSSLSSSSFWSTKYQDDLVFIEDLNTISNEALEEVSDYYYNNREKSMSYAQKSLIMYESLLNKNTGSNKEMFWNIRILYSLYTLSLYDRLILEAEKLKIKKDLTNKEYTDISFILIKAKTEKLYILSSTYNTTTNQDKNKNKKNNSNNYSDGFIQEYSDYLSQLDDDIVLYSKSEQDSSKVEEILLMASSCFKNLYLYEKALNYYKSALYYPGSSSNSKAISIRGIIFCGIKIMSTKDLISTVSNILKTQDLKNISQGLEQELLSILSSSLLKEGDNLYGLAEFEKGSNLLIGSVVAFPNIYDKDKICSLGLEMLSLSNSTSNTNTTLDTSVCNNDTDLYIKARFLENNLNFSESANTYLEFIEKNPKDSRVEKSIDRSLKLFSYENDKINTSYLLYKKALYYKAKDDIYNYKKYRLKSLNLYSDLSYDQRKNSTLNKLILSMKQEKNLNQLEKDSLVYIDSKTNLNSLDSSNQIKGTKQLETLISNYNKEISKKKTIAQDRACILEESNNMLGSFYEKNMLISSKIDSKLQYFDKSLINYSSIKGSCSELPDLLSDSYLSILRISKYMLDVLKTSKNVEQSFDVYKIYSDRYSKISALVNKYYALVNEKDSKTNKVISFDYDVETLNNFIRY